MALPDVLVTVRDFALGILPDSVDQVHVKLGVCTSGTVGTLYAFSDQKTLQDTLGTGKLVEAAAVSLQDAGGPVLCMRVTASVAGTTGAITKGNGASPTVASAGAPVDDYEIVLTVTRTGILGAAAFTYTLDGGDSVSPEITVPSGGTYVLGDTGLILTFPAGTYTLGDTYTFTTVGPGYGTADLTAAMTSLLALSSEWKFVHVVGAASTAAGAVTIATLMDGHMTSAFNAARYAFALIEAPDDTASNLATAFASFASVRVGVAGAYEEVVSPLTGRVHKRSSAWKTAARYAKKPISQHPGDMSVGPLPGLDSTRMTVAGAALTRALSDQIDAARIVTHTVVIGEAGAYIPTGRMMAPAGSDFGEVQYREVMDVACRVARKAALRFLNTSVRIDRATGYIDERDARTVEGAILGAVKAALLAPGHVSDVEVTVKRDNNMLSNRTLYVTLRVLPLAYPKFISLDIGFKNPALTTSAR